MSDRANKLKQIASSLGIENENVVELFNYLRGMYWPSEKKDGPSDTAVMLYIAYCERKGLDPTDKVAHIVKHDGHWQILPGVYELRQQAERTGQVAGMDPIELGPPIKKIGKYGDEIMVPEYATCTVYRVVEGQRCPYTYTAYFEECSGEFKNKLNHMWTKRPRGQLMKCAEAGAWRIAFPGALGGEMSVEEIDGQPSVLGDPPVKESGLAAAVAAASSRDAGEASEQQKESAPAADNNDNVEEQPEPKGLNSGKAAEGEGEGSPSNAKDGDTDVAAKMVEGVVDHGNYPWEICKTFPEDALDAVLMSPHKNMFVDCLVYAIDEGKKDELAEWVSQFGDAKKRVLRGMISAAKKAAK